MIEHSHKWMVYKLLVLGVILILVRVFTKWDMWIVLGVILIIKAIAMLVIPGKMSNEKAKPLVHRKR
jgi:membrane-bound ClpP family serine protease